MAVLHPNTINEILHSYFVWSFMDNFEQTPGCTKRFGLIRVNYDALKCTINDSGEWYASRIAANQVEWQYTE